MRSIIIILALALTAGAQAYSGSFLNLYSPISGTEQGNFEFSMNHRFFGAALKNVSWYLLRYHMDAAWAP